MNITLAVVFDDGHNFTRPTETVMDYTTVTPQGVCETVGMFLIVFGVILGILFSAADEHTRN